MYVCTSLSRYVKNDKIGVFQILLTYNKNLRSTEYTRLTLLNKKLGGSVFENACVHLGTCHQMWVGLPYT